MVHFNSHEHYLEIHQEYHWLVFELFVVDLWGHELSQRVVTEMYDFWVGLKESDF